MAFGVSTYLQASRLAGRDGHSLGRVFFTAHRAGQRLDEHVGGIDAPTRLHPGKIADFFDLAAFFGQRVFEVDQNISA